MTSVIARAFRWVLLAGLGLGLLAACGGGGTGETKSQRRVSVRVDTAVAAGETFQFSLGTQGITVTQSGAATAFGTALDEGSAYTVNQTAGPRACTLSANRSGTIGAADVVVTASCGTPPAPPAQRAVSVRVDSTVGAGESFQFSLGAQGITITQSTVAVAFATPLAEGSAYTVNQTSGPRTCTLSANRSGTIGAADVLVTANCGAPAGLSSLIGELRAPVGSAVTLRNNGGDDLALTVPAFAGSADLYNALAFTFATPLADGTGYGVTLATTPVNQTCSAYKGASGTMPVAAGALKVGCEWTYEHVSRNTDGTVRGTYSSSSAPVLGGAAGAVGSTPDGYGDGRFVAFVSTTNLGGAPTGFRQIYFRDRLSGEVILVSKSAAGVEGNNNSFAPAISADGLTVVFESTATNLVAGDTNGVSDIFKWSALTRTIERVSVGPAGEQANGTSNGPTVSGDGKIIAFATGASNLTSGVSGNSTINVVRRDLTTGTNTLITRGTVGSGNGIGVGGSQPALSEDGNRLAFYSFSSQLVAGDNNGLWDIFVYQHDNGSVRRITLTASGGERDQGTESASRIVAPAISGNGRFVAYATTSTNVVAGDTNGLQDVFVVDLDGPGIAVKRVSVNGATQGNGDSPKGQGERAALSYDGTWVAFTTNASNLGVPADNVLMANVATGELRAVTSLNSAVSGPASISRSAAYVVFGANSQLDGRFANTGLFAYFTGLARAWWWID